MNDAWKPMLERADGKFFVGRLARAMFLLLLLVCASVTPLALTPTTVTGRRTLGFLSFDLDDTLFPTSQVVNDANHRMIEHMREYGFADASIPAFLDATRSIRQSLDRPIKYTDLRKRAIEMELKRLTGSDLEAPAGLPELVETCYQVWETERHAAAERYLFIDAISTLESIRHQYPGTCIAAITNGKGNPLLMPNTVATYFDFCVSGEDDNVFPNRKPHAGIYHVALEKYRTLYPHHDENSHVWCHVGDCLANDVGASAECGAYAVWLCPEEQGPEFAASRLGLSNQQNQPSWSTASQTDSQERSMRAEIAKEKIAKRITRLSELSDAVNELVSASVFENVTAA
jgi:putative hydrolase of the HAD superfamily